MVSKRIKKIIWITLGSLALIFIGFVTYIIIIIHSVVDNPFDDMTFNQKVWLENNANMKPDNPRGKMIEDLQNKYLKKGMHKSEIIKLLGEPDCKTNSYNIIAYHIGFWSGFKIDPDTLNIKLDYKGRLISSRVVQH